MKFTMEEFVNGVMASDMSEESKNALLASVRANGKVKDGFYLRKDDDGMLECWYANVDEYGTIDRGPTNYTVEQVIEEYKYSIKQK